VHALLAHTALIPVLAVLTVLLVLPQLVELLALQLLFAAAKLTSMAMPEPVRHALPVLTVESVMLRKRQVPPPLLFVHAPPTLMEPIPSLLLHAPPAPAILPHLGAC
jgi:hypothetical protein